MDLAPGSRIGNYRIVEVLGRGGMGVVYKAHDEGLDRLVAVKVISGAIAGDPKLRKRFQREAQAAAGIAHPNVAATYFVGEHEGSPYFALELVPGGSVASRLKKGPIPWKDAASLGAQVADALTAIHAAGLVHRDLKPENILLDARGRPKLVDFGLARRSASEEARSRGLTKTGELLGTLEYMAPEQADDARGADARADLYALGASIFCMVSGRPPFQGTGYALVKKHLVEPPPPLRSLVPDAPRSLDKLVARLLAKEPEKRGDAEQVARELEEIAREGPAAGRRGASSRASVFAGALAFVVLASVGAYIGFGGSDQPIPVPSPSEKPKVTATPRPTQLPSPSPGTDVTDLARGFARSPKGWIKLAGILGGYEWKCPTETVGLALSRDGKQALVADASGTLRIFDLPGGREARSFRCRASPSVLALAPDGKTLLAGTSDGWLALVDVATGKMAWEKRSHEASIGAVAFSPDGRIVLSASDDRTLAVLEPGTGSELARLKAHTEPVTGAGFFPDGKRAISASCDKSFKIWDLSRFPVPPDTKVPSLGSDFPHLAFALSDDGKRALTAHRDPEGDKVTLWDLDLGTIEEVFAGHEGTVASVAFVPGGKRFLSASADATVRLWESGNQAAVAVFQHRRPCRSVAATPDGKHAVVTSADGTLGFWDLEQRTDARRFSGHAGAIRSLAITADGKRLLSGSDDATVKVWDLSRGAVERTLVGHRGPVTVVAISSDGKRAVSTTNEGNVMSWNLETGEEQKGQDQLPGPSARPTPVAPSPHGPRFISVNGDGTIVLFDAASKVELDRVDLATSTDVPLSVAFSPDGRIAYVGTARGVILRFELDLP